MQFGLQVSSEIFQKGRNWALECLEGADDIPAYGPTNTTDDILTYYDHKAELMIQCDACQKSLLYYEVESRLLVLAVPWPILRQDVHK